MHEARPDPDEVLRRVQESEARARRGRLKVFFGASPGVGKTYAMLEAARRARAEGRDLVVGLAETHGRRETEALLQGQEILPRRQIAYRGKTLTEFDLDAALQRKPSILLVDELAHSNAEGSRHPKRWQDVTELLDAGIEVWTTLNVQHLESLNDVVAQVTGVRVRETLPDAVLEQADEVELVDLPPEALLQRLREGRVYAPEQAGRAASGFFKRGNLLALRELALRRTAEQVDADVLAHRREAGIETTWPVAEHVVVCVGPTPFSADLVRAARRMAAGLRARWTAVSVEVEQARLDDAARARLRENLRLAEQLGAQVVMLTGHRVSEELLAWAREHNATRILLGKPTHARWRDLVFGSLLDEVVRGSGEIEVHAIAGVATAREPHVASTVAPVRASAGQYAGAVTTILATTGIAALAQGYVATSELVMIYLLGIVVCATRFGRGPSVLASALSVAAVDFCFIPPRWTFDVTDVRYMLTFAMMFVIGVVISGLTDRIRVHAAHARRREQRTADLYALSRELARGGTVEQIVAAARQHIGVLFDAVVQVHLAQPGPDGHLQLSGVGKTEGDERDRSVAAWVFAHGKPAGLTTDTLAAARSLFLPLEVGSRRLGALGVSPKDPARVADPVQRQLLETFSQQIASALDRAQLAEEAHTARLQAERQELRNTLLSSVSHDLRTPLAAITGSATTLLDDAPIGPATRTELLETIRDEAERLNRLVGNLLDMTRLESGGLKPKQEWTPLEEVIGGALERAGQTLRDHQVRLDLPRDLPLVPLDSVLIEQVLLNLLDNAVKYTPPGTPIDISASALPGHVAVEVADHGPGIPLEAQERVFDKFFRAPSGTGVRGTGLGLAIVQGIVAAHGGSVAAANRPGGGTVFRFTLPVPGEPAAPPTET
jgi:two-component system sensor histidine kinase KdpD